jgi:long-chain acyl-CoA synthetase
MTVPARDRGGAVAPSRPRRGLGRGPSPPEWGEEVVVFVVARPGAEIATHALDRLCLDHIARFKRPRRYRFVGALPKNNYGKVLKTELRGLLAE